MLRMVTSYSIFLLVIIILSIYLYSTTMDNLKSRFQTQNQALLKNSIQMMDKDFQLMDVFSRQLLQNQDFWAINLEDDFLNLDFRRNAMSLQDYLAHNIYPDTMLPLQDFFLYLPSTGHVLSPSLFTARNLFYQNKRYDADSYEEWCAFLHDRDSYWNLVSVDPYFSVTGNHYYFYTVPLNTLNYRYTDITLTFILDELEMYELFTQIDFHNTGYLIVCNEDGEIMFSLGGWDQSRSEKPSDLSADIITSLSYDGSFSHFDGADGAMLVTRAYSSEMDWTYYLIQPEEAVYTGMYDYRFVYLLALLFLFLLGIYMVYVFSRRNLAPIVELGEELQVVNEEKSQLQQVVDKQKPIIASSYVQQLLNGTISSEDEMLYVEDYLGLQDTPHSYNVVYIVAYNNGESSDNTSYLSTEEFESVMRSSLLQYFGEPFFCYSPASRSYALLLSCEEAEADYLIMKVQKIIVHLHEFLLDTYGIWMFAGIGHTTNNIMNTWEAYQQAVEAVSYTTKNYIFFPYEIIKKDSQAFYYPPELSTKLIHFITTGNKPQVLELFGLIHQENIEERSLPVNLLQFLMQDIRNTLLKARFSLPTGTDQEAVSALDNRFNEHLSFKLCEDIALSLCELFQGKEEDTNLIGTIEKYIMNNFRDPSLCLNKISDEFQISESYFSHSFKEKTGVNFSVYLENIRMGEAARLIQETDANLSELYIEVGYNNPATFRRVFKKTYGVTPSAMKDSAANGR